MIISTSSLSTYYRQTFDLNHALTGNKIVEHTDIVGAWPVGAVPTTCSFSTEHLASVDWKKKTTRRGDKYLSFGILCS